MKKYLIYTPSLLFICLTAGSCRKGRLSQFEIVYEEEFVVSQGASLSIPFIINSPDREINSEAEFESNDTRKDKVEEIKLTGLKLTIDSPVNKEFDFLKDMEIYIDAEDLPKLLLAAKKGITNSVGNEIELEVSNEDFKEYIKKDKFSLKMRTVADEQHTEDLHIKSRSVFFVDAKLLGRAK
jgi:hypothetical protein